MLADFLLAWQDPVAAAGPRLADLRSLLYLEIICLCFFSD